MISKYRRTPLSLALTASILGTAAWSPHSMACAVEPYMASVCIMTWPKTAAFGGGLYTIAAGQTLQVNEYQALYSLIGNTYGGNARQNTFALPDLRGRVIVGVGQGPGLPTYTFGNQGGLASVQLTQDQLPNHDHALGSDVSVTSGPGTLRATTSLGTLAVDTAIGTLAVNTTVGSLSAASSISGLTATLNAATGLTASGVQNPAGAALPTISPPTRFYTNTAPSIAMAAGSVTLNGTVATTLSGSPASTLTGAPASTLTGSPATQLSGSPLVAIGGITESVGNNEPVPTMPPYTALVYYIATGGIYPTPD